MSMGKENWYKSRRVWGAILSGIVVASTIIFPDKYDLIIAAASCVAGSLGITSWVKPKT